MLTRKILPARTKPTALLLIVGGALAVLVAFGARAAGPTLSASDRDGPILVAQSDGDTQDDEEEELLFFGDDEQKEETVPSKPIDSARPARNWEAKVNLGGYWQNEIAIDTVQENSDEDVIDFRSKIFGYGSYKFSDRTSLNLSLKTLYWVLEGGNDRQLMEFDLYEAYLTFHFKKTDLYLGQMIVKWGVGDVLSPVDSVNPINYRIFIDPASEDLRIPVPMAKVDYYHEQWTLEALYMPIFQSAKFELAGTDLSQVGLKGNTSGIPAPIIDIYNKNKDALLLKKFDFQEEKMILGEVGARAAYHKGTTRIEFLFLSSHEDFPSFRYRPGTDADPELARLKSEYDPYLMYGLAYKTYLDGIDLRFEYAHSPERTLTEMKDTNGDGTFDRFYPAKSEWQALALEADYLDPEGDYFVKLGFQKVNYFDAPPNLLFGSKESLIFLAALRLYMLDNTLSPEWRIVNLQAGQNGWYISPRITYSFKEEFSVMAGLNLYTGGGASGPSSDSQTSLGPISILSDNNQAFCLVRWVF